jgi:Cytidylate kinase-like family
VGIVTVSASYGAAGAEIAPLVAARLGLPFHDRAIPAQVAGRLGVPVAEAEANDETVVGGLWRLVASLGTMPDPVGGVLPMAGVPDARAYRQQTERILGEMAEGSGGVVLGRAVARSGRSRDEISREMAAADRSREAYVRHFYRCDPAEARHYHLVADSTVLPVETVVDLIVIAARARGIGSY